MKSPMLPADHQAAVRRALALGRSGDPAVLPELIGMLHLPSNEIQRLAPSAIGKLVEFGADAEAAVAALAPLALKARHPQTQQYALRALKKCGPAAKGCVALYYQQEGKCLISVHPTDLHELDSLLSSKLRLFGYAVGCTEIEAGNHEHET